MMRIPSILTSIVFLSASRVYAASNVTVNSAGHAQPRTLYGLMFEDINSGDGGLYAELLQNRAFQTVQPGASNSLTAWSGLGSSQISVGAADPPVSAALPNALVVTAPTNATGEIGFSNSGFWGINVKSEWTYTGSFYYRFPGEGSAGSFKVALRSADNTVEFASASVPFEATSEWTKAEFIFQPTSSANDINNIFVVSLDGEAVRGTTLQFALFSLFPPTFKGRKNGMRIDLSQTLADMKPTIFRWPGGNNLEVGSVIANRWKWFNTLGDLLERPGRPGDWSYPNTDGLGIFEYLQWVEDMGMESIMGVYAGYSLRGETVPEADIGPYVEEAINQASLIEASVHFAIGDPATNEWAARRAALGHPEPFDVKYIEIGNEDFFAPDSYHAYRWRAFYNGLSAVFPYLKYIATSGESAAVPDISPAPDHWDLHIYSNPRFFREGSYNFDVAPRNGLQFFQGEYAVTRADDGSQVPYPTIEAAVAEAAYLTGFDRNSDIVFATAYAPLLNHINSTQWIPDLISFSPNTVIRSTSYYVQRFFGTYKGDTYLTSTTNNASNPLQWSVTQSTDKSQIYFKVVNTALTADVVVFTLPPAFTILSDAGHGSVLTAPLGTANTPENPNAAVPVDFDFTVGEGGIISYNVPALSASVLIVSAQA